ncbi:hypothetical protein HYO03_22645 [Vibrio parahaemolyticus]|uniref:hypothetical protein n=1 Tax=Vibrio parahaemolyticus TaxID=670 RepID=UPI0005F0D0F2|nr:hypothetical protein [Vibrio parahaemolyticus]MBE4205870.1 hypothetical protein [Vibrio parahaemolyticus]MBM5068832.1 hypothetical protein [Vibrio parahaemolyticus]
MELVKKISQFEDEIVEHYSRLNSESVWFFVATIGCWSIDKLIPLFFAMLLIVIYFTFRIFDGVNWRQSFKSQLKNLREQIDKAQLAVEEKKELIGSLTIIQEEYLGLLHVLKHNAKFVLAWIFYGISVYYFVIEFQA